MPLGFENEMAVAEYVYDFVVDGGAVGSIDLSAKDNKAGLPVGSVIVRATMKTDTAPTSGGAATIAVGHADTADALHAAAAFGGGDWDANDVTPCDAGGITVADANDGKVSLTIATAALTAGKIRVLVEYWRPSSES